MRLPSEPFPCTMQRRQRWITLAIPPSAFVPSGTSEEIPFQEFDGWPMRGPRFRARRGCQGRSERYARRS